MKFAITQFFKINYEILKQSKLVIKSTTFWHESEYRLQFPNLQQNFSTHQIFRFRTQFCLKKKCLMRVRILLQISRLQSTFRCMPTLVLACIWKFQRAYGSTSSISTFFKNDFEIRLEHMLNQIHCCFENLRMTGCFKQTKFNFWFILAKDFQLVDFCRPTGNIGHL